jgi:hypothetical protein
MRTNEILLSLVTAVFAGMGLYWLSHQRETTDSMKPAPGRIIKAEQHPDAPPIPRLDDAPAGAPIPAHPGRDIFLYAEVLPARRESPRVAELMPSAPPAPAVQEATAPLPTVTAPPSFDYRFLGTFGPRKVQFAVFEKQGDIINVREGEPIGPSFLLRRIGIESVEVVHASAPADVRRVALAQ